MRILIGLISILLICGCSQSRDLKHTVFSGTLELTEHVLGAKSAGRIAMMNVQEGDLVVKNQLLATLDRFEQTKKDYERKEKLYKTGGVDQQSLEYARLAMEDQQIMSPIDGIVLVKVGQTGEIIPAGAGVIVVGDLKDQWVKIFIPEGLIAQIVMNQKALISFDGSTKKYQGHVSFIASKSEFTPRNVQTSQERITQTFAVKIALDEREEYLHPGIAGDIVFID